jgi:pyruvate kinase
MVEAASQKVNVVKMAEKHASDSYRTQFSHIFDPIDPKFRKVKVICTLGPSCWDIDMLVKMLDAGMNVARLNFSHGDHKTHAGTIDRLREAMKQRPDKHCAIMLDTKGPEIRTGINEGGKPIKLVKDQPLEITTDYSFAGTSEKIACSYEQLPESVKVGGIIFIADGSLTCEVTEILEVMRVFFVLILLCRMELKSS